MACLPGMPCFGPLVRVVYPPTCDPFANRIVSSDNVEYNGDNLSCTGIQNCDTLTVALQKIDNKICSDAFVAQIIQTIANDDVLLAYFCQLVYTCSPTTTTTSSSTSSTSSTTTTTTTAFVCDAPTITSIESNGPTSLKINWSSTPSYTTISVYRSFDGGLTYNFFQSGTPSSPISLFQGSGTTVYYKLQGACSESSFSALSTGVSYTN
jgi:hypothetical protein